MLLVGFVASTSICNSDNIIINTTGGETTMITTTITTATTPPYPTTTFTTHTTYSTFILLYINMSNNGTVYRGCSKTKTITTTSHERTKTMKINITSMTARNTANTANAVSPLEMEAESADKARVEELLRDVEDKIVDSDAFTGETPETTVSEFYDEDGLCILSVTETPNKAVFNFHLANEEYELLPTK